MNQPLNIENLVNPSRSIADQIWSGFPEIAKCFSRDTFDQACRLARDLYLREIESPSNPLPGRAVAIIADKGRIFVGCDLQNAAGPSTLHAVNDSINSAAESGFRIIDGIIVYGPPSISAAELELLRDLVPASQPFVPLIKIAPDSFFIMERLMPSRPLSEERFPMRLVS